MNLKEYLWTIKDDIPCEACGQCCPRICPGKKGKLCSGHPAVTGKPDQRDYVCTLTPVELASLGAASVRL